MSQGIYVQPELVDLLIDKQLDAQDLILLGLIDGYTNRQEMKGCYATNQHIGEVLKLSESQVSRRITRLKKHGLLVQTAFTGRRRYLMTTWTKQLLETTHGMRRQHTHPTTTSKKHSLYCDNNRLLRDDSSSRGSEEDEMGFFYEKEPKPLHKTKPPSPFHIMSAIDLREIILTKTRVKVTTKLMNDADHIRLLEQQNEVSQERIENVLLWYMENMGKEYIPRAITARQFREKFAAIEAAMQRDEKDNPVIEIGDKAQGIAKTLKQTCRWPKGSELQLPVYVQKSLEFKDDLYKRLNRVDGKLKGFADHVKAVWPFGRVQEWYEGVNRKVSNWEDWSGEIGPWALHRTSKEFNKVGRSLAVEYCNNANRWDELMEELYADTEA